MKNQKLLFEAAWLLVAVLVAFLILGPIRSKAPTFTFMTANAIYIVLFITLSRALFTLKYSPWAKQQWLKAVLILVSLPMIFLLVESLNNFLAYIDDNTMEAFTGHLDPDQAREMNMYIRTEMIFFGTGSIIAALLFPFRLMISIWRQRNRGTV